MLKKTITFKDLDGNDVTEDFYFNLTKAEIAELQLSHKGGYAEHLKRVISTDDGGLIISTFKDLVMRSVGRRSEDGRRFIKNKEIADEFLQSEAYSEMFLKLVTDANEGAAFVRAIMPADIVAEVDKEATGIKNVELPVAPTTLSTGGLLPDPVPAWIKENREPTQVEINNMSPEEFKSEYLRKMSKPSE